MKEKEQIEVNIGFDTNFEWIFQFYIYIIIEWRYLQK